MPQVLSVVAPVVMIAALAFLGATGNLVSRSPVAIVLQLGAVALAVHPSVLTVGVGTVATLAVALRIAIEERMLRARYQDYARCARTTKAIVPYVL